MYDMTSFVPRYFNIKLKNGKELAVEPPKLKVLKQIMNLASTSKDDIKTEDFDNIIIATSKALSKNKQNYPVSTEWLTENHNIDELITLLYKYFEWVKEIQTSKN